MRALLLFVLLACLARPAGALEPERRAAVAIAARVWDGHDYRETFVPSSLPEIVLMAGRDSAILFVDTEEYYWPLSRLIYADFRARRDPVEGALVIRQGGRELARLSRGLFAVHYPQGAAAGGAELLWGAEAEAAHAAHRAAERAFVRDFWEARRAHTDYERRLVESAAEARRTGRPPEPVPPPPPLPEPLLRLVTPPEPGFRIALPPGLYSIAIEEGGATVAGTERRLRVVDPAGSRVVVADVVPAERWTRPLPANAPEARIYARPGTTFYVVLAEADRFREPDYLPVVAPQREARAERLVWVRRGPAAQEALRLAWDGQPDTEVSRGAFRVEQTAGSGFGYRIRPAEAGERAELQAFAVEVPEDAGLRRGRLTDPGGGAAFARTIVAVQPREAGPALALALAPLALFAAWRVLVRLRGRRNRAAGAAA